MKRNYTNHKIGKSIVKLGVIRDSFDDSVQGYTLGNYKLIKYYTWGNDYSWLICERDFSPSYFSHEASKEHENGLVEYVGSCKQGKDLLVDLYIADVRL